MKHKSEVLIIFIYFIILIISPSAYADNFLGKAVAVHDGDTISVLKNGKASKIRLAGIDAPEKDQAFGIKAKVFTSNTVFGKTVMVEVIDTDHYRRLVAKIVLQNGKCLNHELLKAGFAWWYRQYAPEDNYLRDLELEAQRNKRGLWKDKNPIPPWEFRKSAKTSSSSLKRKENKRDFGKSKISDTKKKATRQNQNRSHSPARSCCRICRKGKACGDSCISRRYTCHKGPGCACDSL